MNNVVIWVDRSTKDAIMRFKYEHRLKSMDKTLLALLDKYDISDIVEGVINCHYCNKELTIYQGQKRVTCSCNAINNI